MQAGEQKAHARLGTVATIVGLLLTWTGMVVNVVEWKEAVRLTREDQVAIRLELSNVHSRIEGLRTYIDTVAKENQDPVLIERLAAMQKQLDRIERKVMRW